MNRKDKTATIAGAASFLASRGGDCVVAQTRDADGGNRMN